MMACWDAIPCNDIIACLFQDEVNGPDVHAGSYAEATSEDFKISKAGGYLKATTGRADGTIRFSLHYLLYISTSVWVLCMSNTQTLVEIFNNYLNFLGR